MGVQRLRMAVAAGALGVAVALISGCSSSATGQAPDAATSATPVPGAAPQLGQGSQGGISITETSIQRAGDQLAITARIHNGGSRPDELDQIGSQVSVTLTLNPPLQVPAGATRELGSGGTPAVLQQQGRLSDGGTVDLTLQFRDAGVVQVFSSFR